MSRTPLHALVPLAALAVAGLAPADPAVAGSPAAPTPSVVRTICYDTSQATGYADTARQAAMIWNDATVTVHLAPCGQDVIVSTACGGGSRTIVTGPGTGHVHLDRCVAGGGVPLRALAHEFGHVLGLPDSAGGGCVEVMSTRAGCADPYPTWMEAYRVDAAFAGGATAGPVDTLRRTG